MVSSLCYVCNNTLCYHC